ncbi:transcriptional regulator, TetR family [Catenulispora acidiphila DSM 44928]|uniref:Transcriptional regulator, TetR family n=1 Tax=Catenulispora acidiphila (strain DSM 44928 / JCM 14897 / NBRC 102108 / NRRL B-24433 / ID139908) TaxID=479433 RepID=C7QJD2_CATAD|nr:TetR family transcriptional regulator [Catenulispora acidiphila]ACU71155.1 transcriptional regulator, TetR family [Catenulispora acidiphila DSM 44928]
MPQTDQALAPAPAPTGLRERKKARTRAAIQRHALRLFREAGYSATTMEQIAAAADVSPSTLYRYFPTKEDLILQDDYDPLLEAAFRAQPPDLPILEAFRTAVNEAMSQVPPTDQAEALERARMAYTIPEVRARALDHMFTTTDMIATLFAERLNRTSDDLEVRVLAGTVIGAVMAAQQRWISDPDADMFGVLDRALQFLIDGPGHLGNRPAQGA